MVGMIGILRIVRVVGTVGILRVAGMVGTVLGDGWHLTTYVLLSG